MTDTKIKLDDVIRADVPRDPFWWTDGDHQKVLPTTAKGAAKATILKRWPPATASRCRSTNTGAATSTSCLPATIRTNGIPIGT